MKKKFKVAQGFYVTVRSREKTFERDAAVEVVLDYDAWADGAHNDSAEEEAQKIAQRIASTVQSLGTAEIPPDRQYEGEVVISIAVQGGHTAAEVARKVGQAITRSSGEIERQELLHRDSVKERRMAAVVTALQTYKGQTLDDAMIPMIAEDVLDMLKQSKRGR